MKHEQKNCERCGATFECKIGNITQCQCSEIVLTEATKIFLEESNFDCLCKNCLHQINEKMQMIAKLPTLKSLNNNLTEHLHYYQQGNLFVFTETYHLLRGYCCRNGCRHCPYGYNY